MKNSKKTLIGSLVGYSAVVLLIAFVGAISIFQIGTLGKNVEYLAKDVAGKVKNATELEPALVDMKTSVEVFVRSSRDDSSEADQSIAKVNLVLGRADKEIKEGDELKILNEIKLLTNEYVEKYRDIANMIGSRNKNQSSIVSIGNDIYQELGTLSEEHQGGALSDRIASVQNSFLEATVGVEKFFVTYDSQYATSTEDKIAEILEEFASDEAEELQDVMYAIEDDYLDTFLGISAVIHRMNQMIEQELFPIAPEIMALTKKISDSGWTDMETARQDTESRVDATRTLIIVLGIVAIGLGMLIGFISSTRAATAEKKNERQYFLQKGQTELNEKTRGEQDVATTATSIITYLCEYLEAKVGAFYVFGAETKVLQLLGSYAYQERKNISNEFKLGEGMVGQAALEKKTIMITDCPDDYISVSSGLGNALPRNIVLFPVVLGDVLMGVMEIGWLKESSELHLAFMDQVAENIAIAINSSIARSNLNYLLEQTQEQAEQLKNKQEELHASNAELEEQSKILRESEARLQVQQEELKATNQELEELAEQLKNQQEELRASNEELEEQSKILRDSEARLQVQQEELKATNEELEEQTEVLRQQKEDITRKNADLERATALVEEKAADLAMANKYKSEFLANMSHELRTPLNSMLLLSKLLADNKDGNLSDKQKEFADTIHTSGAELLSLINDILDLSKVEAGKLDVNLEEANLNEFAKSMERNFKHVAEDKGISMDVDHATDLPTAILTDRQRLDQIVRNLFSNALKFTSKGGITLTIGRPDDQIDLSDIGLDRESTIAFSVTDTGIGIPEEKLKVIFEAFQQADGTTSRKFGGTGLGLSISRELAKLLGGELRLTSEEGKGSTFTLYLPQVLQRGAEQQSPPPQKPSEAEAPRPSADAPQQAASAKREPPQPSPGLEMIHDDRKETSPQDKSILIIEDDPKFAKILCDLSREKGFKVLVAGDGETGLHFADYYIPSAIVLDIGLPGIDGFAVMSRLKENSQTRHIPVHFISASDMDIDALRMGAVGYFTKPVSMEQLDKAYGTIEQVISRTAKNLLLVEDNETQRKAIIELIGNGDIHITSASTGKEAYNQLLAGDFDCVILDLGLPDMSGMELLEKIRNDESIMRVPIIVYTGRDLTKEEKMTLDEYAEKVIIKGAKSPEKLLDETTLFLHRVEADLPDHQRQMLQMIHDKESILKDKIVLLADDDMRNVFAITNTLEAKDMNVLVAKNGKEALECLGSRPDVDLVLMDIMMPEMDGYEAIREIRKKDNLQKIPIIALTAKAMKGDRSKCIEAGANDYLAKPVDTEKLFSMLRVWLYG